MADNYNCSGAGPHAPGEVRKLPIGESNDILCRACHRRELAYRRARNRELGELNSGVAFDLPMWESLEVYSEVV